jgi:hypothetical protein
MPIVPITDGRRTPRESLRSSTQGAGRQEDRDGIRMDGGIHRLGNLNQESQRMSTVNMPNVGTQNVVPTSNQGRPIERRFRLQVDRQTKRSFATLVEAEKAATSIKAEHPIVTVSIYDAEESKQITLGA